MTRQGQFPTPPQAYPGAAPTRPETGDEDRPFAEIRKNLQDALRILSLHRWAFFVPCCLVASGAFLVSLHYPRTFTATTVFERRNDPIMVDLPNSAGAASFKYFRSTMERDLTSVAYMTDVVEDLGMTGNFERQPDGQLTEDSTQRRGALARSLGGTISIQTTSPSEHIDIVRMTYTGPDPAIGAKLLDAVKRTYIRRTMVWIHEFLESQRDYFQRALEEAVEAMKLAQRGETRLRLESPHVDPQDPGSITGRLEQLEIERRELQLRRREYEAELSSLQQMRAATEALPLSTIDDEGVERTDYVSAEAIRVAEQIHKIDEEMERLRGTRGMTDEHPEIRELAAARKAHEIELVRQRETDQDAAPSLDAKELRRSHVSLGIITAAQPWQSERARLIIQIGTQEAKIRDIDFSLETNALSTQQLEDAKSEVFVRQEEFSDVLAGVSKARQRHNEILMTLARIEPAIKAIEQDRLLQFTEGEPARGSSVPVNPKASTIILLALLAGVAAGVVFVVLAEILDRVYRSSSQVARTLGLPILDSIDEIITSQDRRRRLIRQSVVAPLTLAGFLSLAALTGALAYLSIQRPWTYQKIISLPDRAMGLLAGNPKPSQPEESPAITF